VDEGWSSVTGIVGGARVMPVCAGVTGDCSELIPADPTVASPPVNVEAVLSDDGSK